MWSKLLIGYATFACYVGVILTGSRGGYLSVMASFVVFGILSFKVLRATGSVAASRVALTGLVAGILAVSAAGYIIQRSEVLSKRTKNAVTAKDFRLDLWR